MRLKFWQQILSGKTALNEVGAVNADQLPNCTEVAVYVKFSAGAAAGVVLLEGSHDANFTGTWATVGTVNWVAADRVHLLAVTGVHKALRVRISSAITGGTADAYAMGA